MRWIDRWYVKSHTSEDKEYTVSRADDGETWGCSCPAWTFQRHRIRDGICKHIRQIQSLVIEMDRETELQSQNAYPSNIVYDNFFTEEEFAL